jgi:hypothetical protein
VIGVVKGLSIWIILALALGSSVVVLLAMGTFRYVMQSRGEQDGSDPENLDFEATPQGTVSSICFVANTLSLYHMRKA